MILLTETALSSSPFHKFTTLALKNFCQRFLWVSNNVFTFVLSCLVCCPFKEPLPLYTASFPMIILKAWIISCLLFLLANVVCPHPFNLFLQLKFVGRSCSVVSSVPCVQRV